MVSKSELIVNNLTVCDRHLSYCRRILALGPSSSIELSFKQVGLHYLSGFDVLEYLDMPLSTLNKYLLIHDEGSTRLT